MSWGKGLTGISTTDLKQLLRLVHSGEVRCPLSADELTRVGLQKLLGSIDNLRDLDTRGVRAVLVAVLAERL